MDPQEERSVRVGIEETQGVVGDKRIRAISVSIRHDPDLVECPGEHRALAGAEGVEVVGQYLVVDVEPRVQPVEGAQGIMAAVYSADTDVSGGWLRRARIALRTAESDSSESRLRNKQADARMSAYGPKPDIRDGLPNVRL